MGNPIFNMLGGSVGGQNPMFSMLMSMMGGGKPNMNTMVNQLIQNNPQAKQAWQQAQEMAKGKSQSDIQSIVEDMASKNGISKEQLQSMIKQFK